VRSLSLRPGDSLTTPWVAWSMGFSSFSFLPELHPSYGASGFYPGGTQLPLNVLAFLVVRPDPRDARRDAPLYWRAL
jgi:hypothetical protein